MIKSFKHGGLKNFFETGNKAGINPKHAKRLRLILFKLDTATDIEDMAFPGSNLHPLRGKRKGYWAVNVSGNWRVIFQFKGENAYNVNYIDYH
jgi:proteic killer suppression protein